MSFPFQEERTGDARIRVFSSQVDQSELVWHRDDEDRVVRVVEGSGWYFQRDGQLPEEMCPGDVIRIRRREWHRVLRKGTSKLVVEIRVES